ncbi:uncharacterized protein LOC144057664 [Vanacampus margaritifer]
MEKEIQESRSFPFPDRMNPPEKDPAGALKAELWNQEARLSRHEKLQHAMAAQMDLLSSLVEGVGRRWASAGGARSHQPQLPEPRLSHLQLPEPRLPHLQLPEPRLPHLQLPEPRLPHLQLPCRTFNSPNHVCRTFSSPNHVCRTFSSLNHVCRTFSSPNHVCRRPRTTSAAVPGPRATSAAAASGPRATSAAAASGPRATSAAAAPGPRATSAASTAAPGPRATSAASTAAPGPRARAAASTAAPGPRARAAASTAASTHEGGQEVYVGVPSGPAPPGSPRLASGTPPGLILMDVPDLIMLQSSTRTPRSSNMLLLQVSMQYQALYHGRPSFLRSSTATLEQAPNPVEGHQSLDSFKSDLKTFLFRQAYDI